jgi:protein TonB
MRFHHLPACLLLAAVLLSAMLLSGCDKPRPPAKAAQNVKLLPDTPPPPPPPKQEEKRVEPRKEDRPQPQMAQPRPAPAPEPQALKSDEAPGAGAGNGLAAGAVTQDYQGGPTGSGNGGSGNSAAERLAANSYAQAATRALNDYLLREKNLRLADYRLQINVWLQADGRMQRAELVGSSGDAQLDAALREALQRFPGLAMPLPERMPQPMRLRVSNRMMG